MYPNPFDFIPLLRNQVGLGRWVAGWDLRSRESPSQWRETSVDSSQTEKALVEIPSQVWGRHMALFVAGP